MTKEQIQKSKWLSEIYAAVAAGEVIQVLCATGEWRGISASDNGPHFKSDPTSWRIAEKPLRMWTAPGAKTHDKDTADRWKEDGEEVKEWMEVLP